MLNLTNLKNELIGFEGDALELNAKMSKLGFYEELENWKEILESECVSYVVNNGDGGEFENIILDFKITIEPSEDEIIEATNFIITDIRG